MPVVTFKGTSPKIDSGAFIAPDAWVTGDTEISAEVSIFFGASLRGDLMPIKIGKGTNIQEHAVLHTTHEHLPCLVGDNVTIGHQAILHGCEVKDRCIIGMGAVILDGAVIEEDCIIGAQTLVPMNTRIPKGSLVIGVPAKVKRDLTEKEKLQIIDSAERYIKVGQEYKLQLENNS